MILDLDILIPAIFTAYRPKVDKSCSLSFSTLEMSSDAIGKFHGLQGRMGSLVFKAESELTKNEMLLVSNMETEIGGKTKSERLRNVLYKNFQLETKDHKDFNSYYATEMERIIQHYKDKLI